MELHNYGRGVLHVVCPDAEELAYSFLRIQESKSNPLWRNKKSFTEKEYLDQYSKLMEIDGRWEYHREYVGVSVKSEALIPFYGGRFDPISKREGRLLRLLEKPTNRGRKRAFIIGSTNGDTDTMNHELSRAFSYVDVDYRQSALKIVRKIPVELRKIMREWFINDGSFLPSVIPHEIVAEFADWYDSYMFREQHIDRRNRTLQRVHREIKDLFETKLKTLDLSK